LTTEKARDEYRRLRRSFTPATGVTRTLAEHVTDIQYGDLPAPLVARAKIVVLEALGKMVSGARQDTSRKLLRYIRRLGGEPEATILYHGDKTHMGNAALANGAFGYGATASVVVPATLAVGEKMFANGHEVVTALITGWETQERLAAATLTTPQERPLHPLSTFGPFGAAVAAAKLLRLGVDAMEDTLTCCTAQAAGTLQAQAMGSESERLVPGFAASYGVMAARMAQQGISGARDILEGRAGFYMCIAGLREDGTPKYDLDAITHAFGSTWRIGQREPRPMDEIIAEFKSDAGQAEIAPARQDDVIERVNTLEEQDDLFTILADLDRQRTG
jgi:2-methylcitrate dehydratase PrpD